MTYWEGDSPALMCGWEGCSLRGWLDSESGPMSVVLCVQHAWIRTLGDAVQYANQCSDDEYNDSLIRPDLYYSADYYDHYYENDDWYSDGPYDDEETVLIRNWYQESHIPDELG